MRTRTDQLIVSLAVAVLACLALPSKAMRPVLRADGFVFPEGCTYVKDHLFAFFEKPAEWSGDIYVWAWYYDETTDSYQNFTTDEWPGVRAMLVGYTADGLEVWQWIGPSLSDVEPTGIIFSDNNYTQTGDLTFTNGGYYTSDSTDPVAVADQSLPLLEIQSAYHVEQPGTLPSLVDEKLKNSITDMTVTGRLNGTDILFLREMAGSGFYFNTTEGQLSRLDLSGASIVSGGADYCSEGHTEDDVVGPHMFRECNRLVSLKLPSGTKVIRNQAIDNLDNLQELDLGTSLQEIEGYSIVWNSSLQTLTIPQSVTSIGSRAFAYNTALTQVSLSDGVEELPEGVFESCYQLVQIHLPKSLKTMGASIFHDCYALQSVDIPSSVTSIGAYAFQNCCSLQFIDLPAGLTEIAPYCFYYCIELASVSQPEYLVSIGEWAFCGCSRLRSFPLSDRLTFIGDGAFSTTSLKEVCWPSGIDEVPKMAFSSCTQLQKVELPNGVKRIADQAFFECFSLSECPLPATLEYIGSYAFHITAITTLTIPGSVAEVGTRAFSECSRLASLTICEGVNTLRYDAFSSCTSLQTVTIPASVTTFEYGMFHGCSALQEVYLRSPITEIPAYTFQSCSQLHTFELPAGITHIGQQAFEGCSALTSFDIPSTVSQLDYAAFSWCTHLKQITIPQGITSIAGRLFNECHELESVTLPSSVTSIGENAFYNCQSLRAIQLPEGISQIGYYAFCKSGLETFAWPDDIASIGYGTFEGCESLRSISLPETLTSILGSAFYYCPSLSQITIPESVNHIGSYAFAYCYSLQQIHAYPLTPPAIEESTFYDVDKLLCTLYVPDGCQSVYAASDYWNEFLSIVEEGETFDDVPLVAAEWQLLRQFAATMNVEAWEKPWTFGTSPETTGTLRGVTSRQGHVLRVMLPMNNLSGSLDGTLFALPFLEQLDLSLNNISGSIDEAVAGIECSSLTYLNLSGNAISGNIGKAVQSMPSLTTLKAADCCIRDVSPVLPPTIQNPDISHQTLIDEVPIEALISGGYGYDGFPSILRYDESSYDYQEKVATILTDSNEAAPWRSWLFSDENRSYLEAQYYYKLNVYRGENGSRLHAETNGHEWTVRLNFSAGDANFDYAVDVLDLQLQINFIFNQNLYNLFNFTAANLWNDNLVNVQDVVCMVNLLLDEDAPADLRNASRREQGIDPQSVTEATVFCTGNQLCINTSRPVAAFDVIVGSDGSACQVASALKQMGFSCAIRRCKQGFHLIGYSLSDATLPAGNHVIATGDFLQPVHAKLADADALEVPTALATSVPTDIDGIANRDNDAAREAYRMPLGAARHLIIDRNGRKTIRKNNRETK